MTTKFQNRYGVSLNASKAPKMGASKISYDEYIKERENSYRKFDGYQPKYRNPVSKEMWDKMPYAKQNIIFQKTVDGEYSNAALDPTRRIKNASTSGVGIPFAKYKEADEVNTAKFGEGSGDIPMSQKQWDKYTVQQQKKILARLLEGTHTNVDKLLKYQYGNSTIKNAVGKLHGSVKGSIATNASPIFDKLSKQVGEISKATQLAINTESKIRKELYSEGVAGTPFSDIAYILSSIMQNCRQMESNIAKIK